MRIHYLLIALLLLFLMPISAFTQNVRNPVSCIANGGICWGACRGNFKQIGTCGLPKVRCCKKK
ncbi:beta-defensin 4-like isoform X3 [Castor canadensis]|uniref:Beta-defensin 4-like isoform X3 n=1 Tax=Castor canadensis TaxID=51338 RepID=A0AC58L2L7_CASCN